MIQKTCWTVCPGERETIVARVTALANDGHARRIRVERGDRIVAEFPVTTDPIGSMVTRLAAVAALVAYLEGCTVRVERDAELNAAAPDLRVA